MGNTSDKNGVVELAKDGRIYVQRLVIDQREIFRIWSGQRKPIDRAG